MEMVKYLNKQNKTNLLILCLMASEAQHIGEALKLEGQLKRKATTISTYAQKAFESNYIKCRMKDHSICSLKDAMIHMV